MNMSVSRRRWALALAALAVAIAAIGRARLAQERFGGLTGTVKDDSGAVLPGVTVTITNKETGKVYTVVTGQRRRLSRCSISSLAATACGSS